MTYIIKVKTKEEKEIIRNVLNLIYYDKIQDNELKEEFTVTEPFVRITYSKDKVVETGHNDKLEFYTNPEKKKYKGVYSFYSDRLRKDIDNKKLKIVSLIEFIEKIVKIKHPEEYIKIKLTTNL
ncbi:MAG: hypothetical protein ACUVXA_16975 [Candidatus Jordarchaeum sp.]|uniref:hypothetical protein n=1 Tax=Candidatus Jordarchaeum sp. TaxID=2823881 RepID=UPI0040497935